MRVEEGWITSCCTRSKGTGYAQTKENNRNRTHICTSFAPRGILTHPLHKNNTVDIGAGIGEGQKFLDRRQTWGSSHLGAIPV